MIQMILLKRKRDYSSSYQTKIPEPTGNRPLGNSIGALLGYVINEGADCEFCSYYPLLY